MHKKLAESIDKQLISDMADVLRREIEKELRYEVGNMEVWPIAQNMAQQFGIKFFNLGLAAAREALERRVADIHLDLDLLEER